MAAKSTTAGTPVKSYKATLEGLKGHSISFSLVTFQFNTVSTSDFLTLNSSQFLTTHSNKTLIE